MSETGPEQRAATGHRHVGHAAMQAARHPAGASGITAAGLVGAYALAAQFGLVPPLKPADEAKDSGPPSPRCSERVDALADDVRGAERAFDKQAERLTAFADRLAAVEHRMTEVAERVGSLDGAQRARFGDLDKSVEDLARDARDAERACRRAR